MGTSPAAKNFKLAGKKQIMTIFFGHHHVQHYHWSSYLLRHTQSGRVASVITVKVIMLQQKLRFRELMGSRARSMSCCESNISQVCQNLVDPKDHGILKVKGQLLRGTEGRKALDGSHYFLDADHLYCISHHESVDHGNVCTLQGRDREREREANRIILLSQMDCPSWSLKALIERNTAGKMLAKKKTSNIRMKIWHVIYIV